MSVTKTDMQRVGAIAIPLSDGRLTFVDKEDEDIVLQYNWYPLDVPTKRTVYAIGYLRGSGSGSRYPRLHRLITAAQRGVQIDHWDGDGLNNRRSNLREASQSQNRANATKYRGAAGSIFKGVRARGGSFEVRIGANGVNYIGRFKSELDAAVAYDVAARSIYGSFAACNFPVGGERSALTGEIA